ncbi:myocardin-related transcription factor B isoform X1 [Colossoma macropomum]|uniref:myocardin-related transcription factor B isoform X1 n=2 Tax=Colossoma macropomum TaxID=42526 RepID=UPI0018652039|nr:myocardin-related transcription factor B isoform X1 [Colossoma macropomum]
MEPQGSLGAEGEQGVLVPSPRSEAVTHDMEELSLQPSQSLPPIRERKNVLQLRLQQRRTREQLVDQGIMPPLKTPAAFHEQIRSLERARTENFLKHKIRSRPERAELVRMHILQETQAEASLQATQLKLKRARLADDLNEKIAQRPGPMELVEKNILPVDSSVKEAIIEGEVNYQKTLDVYNFDEDSSEALSPEDPASQESQCSVPSPREAKLPDISSASQSPGSNLQLCPPTTQSAEFFSRTSAEDQANARLTAAPQPATTAAPTKSGPTLLKQSQPRLPSEKSRSKKSKEPKPRVRKLKYHQYIPPDQKQEPNEAPMDSAYARLLQQQQQFLHLQILSQQQQHYNYQAILPAPLRPVAEAQSSCPSVALGNSQALPAPIVVSMPSAAPTRPNHAMNNRKPGPLPANLDEMKVAELKMELKLRGLPVSGTKTDLIERLKPYQESASATTTQPAAAVDTIAPPASQQPDSMSTTPPVSPAQSEVTTAPMEEAVGDSSAKAAAALPPVRPAAGSSPLRAEDMETKVSDKDQRLHEKERQIEELMRKLEQEQRLVEELKMQLEVEKRSQQGAAAQQNDPSPPAHIKEERDASPSCGSMHGPMPVSPAGLKQEEPQAQVHMAPLQQFYMSPPQQLPQTTLTAQPGPHILLPTTMHLTNKSTTPQTQSVLQTTVSGSAQMQTPLLKPLKTESTAFQQHANQTQATPQTMPLCSGSGFQPGQPMTEVPQCFISSSQESCSPRVSPRHSAMNGLTKPPSPCQPTYILPPSTFTNHHSPKSKDPPRYEEAVKQTRALQATLQVPTATSQHMDDLFDVLIESGEISPLIRQDPLSGDKLLPVTASITTLPINTALSRPPPQVQIAHPPEPPPSLVALATDHQLEALLEGTLSADAEPRTLRLMEELHSHLLERPHSPMDTDELAFSDSPPPSLHLNDTNLDNMEWLDLTAPGPTGISASTGVFSSDFLDSHDLNWD